MSFLEKLFESWEKMSKVKLMYKGLTIPYDVKSLDPTTDDICLSAYVSYGCTPGIACKKCICYLNNFSVFLEWVANNPKTSLDTAINPVINK